MSKGQFIFFSRGSQLQSLIPRADLCAEISSHIKGILTFPRGRHRRSQTWWIVVKSVAWVIRMRGPTRGIKVTKNREARKDWALRKIFLPLKIDASPSSASPPLNAAKFIYFVSDVTFFFVSRHAYCLSCCGFPWLIKTWP